MKHTLFIATITLIIHATTYSMSSDVVFVKLNDGTQHIIDTNIAYKSNTIYKKQLWKKRLSISDNLPIVLPDISTRELVLFKKACTYSQETFMSDFFNRLLKKDQRRLTSIVGKTHLNAPEITLLVLQQLPIDIINIISTNFNRKKNKIAHYVQCSIIKKNISQYPTLKQSNPYKNDNNADIHESNGEISPIPDFFSSTKNLCSNSAIKIYKNSPLTKKDTAFAINTITGQTDSLSRYQRFLHYAGKTIGNYTYLITSDQTDNRGNLINNTCFIWCIEKNSERLDDYKIAYQKLPSSFQKIIWSSNGKIIAMNNPNSLDKLWLITLDPLASTIITNKQQLKTNGLECSEITFNNSSTHLAASLYSPIADASTLIIYDISGAIESTLNFSGKCINLSFNNDDSRLIGAITTENQYSKILVINSTNLINITEITPEQNLMSGLKILSVHYNPYKNNIAVAQAQGGHLLLIKESTKKLFKIHYLMHDKKNNRFYQNNQSCYIFSPDGKFIFHNTHSLQAHSQDMASLPLLIPSYFREGRLMIWDIKTKNLIAKQWSSEPVSGQAQIVLDHNENKLATKRDDTSWWLHQLYTQDEHATINWIENNPNLFELYALRQLYRAHKNKEELSLGNNPVLFSILENIPSCPHNIKQCINDYLVHKKETGFYQTVSSFFQNFWG